MGKNSEILKENLIDSLNAMNIDLRSAFVYVEWPESQKFMEEDWFDDKAVLDINNSSAYFIPLTCYINFHK